MSCEIMTLNRNFILVTTAPTQIRFKKDEPTRVPRDMVKDAVAIGAQFSNDTSLTEIFETPAVRRRTATEREDAINQAIAEMVATNNPDDFTAANAPSAKTISAKIGEKLDQKEVNVMWTAYRQLEAAKKNQIEADNA